MRVLAGLLMAAVAQPAPPCSDGGALLRGEHWNRLRACAEERLESDPADGEAHYWLARVKIEAGELEAAQPLAEKAAAALPRRADVRFWMAVVYGRQAESAGLLRRWGLARRFKKEAEAAAALDPSFIDARMALIDFHLRAPSIVGGDEARAEALAAELARLDPSRGWLARARIARHHRRNDTIEELYRRAVEADRHSYGALVELARFYLFEAKRYDDAEDAAARAVKLDASRAAAYPLLAGVYARQKRWSDLDAVLAQLDAQVPDDRYAYYFAAAVLLAHTDELARAERFLRQYLAQEPEIGTAPHTVAHLQLGKVLARQGRTRDAVQELETLLALDPGAKDAKAELARLKARPLG